MLPRLTCGRPRFWERGGGGGGGGGVQFIMGEICSYKQHLFPQKFGELKRAAKADES